MFKICFVLSTAGVSLVLSSCSNEWQLDSDADDPVPHVEYCIKLENEKDCSGSFLKLFRSQKVLQLLNCGQHCGPYQMDFAELRELVHNDTKDLSDTIQWFYPYHSAYWSLAAFVHAKQPVLASR